jgi:hypothetical protein
MWGLNGIYDDYMMIYVFFGEYDGEVGLELGELGFLVDL